MRSYFKNDVDLRINSSVAMIETATEVIPRHGMQAKWTGVNYVFFQINRA